MSRNHIEVFYEYVSMVFEKYGKEVPSLDTLRKEFTIPYMNFWNKYFPDMTIKEQNQMYEEFMSKKEIIAYPKVKEVLERLKIKGIKLFILSSDTLITIYPEIKRAGISCLISDVKDNCHEKTEALKELIKKHDLKTEETVYIGDTSGDVEEAKKAGLKTIAITWGLQSREKILSSKPDFVINKIEEIEDILEKI